MILEDRRLNVREIAEAVVKSSERVYHILGEELGMKKLFTRSVPRLLVKDQKLIIVEISEGSLARFQGNQRDSFCAGL